MKLWAAKSASTTYSLSSMLSRMHYFIITVEVKYFTLIVFLVVSNWVMNEFCLIKAPEFVFAMKKRTQKDVGTSIGKNRNYCNQK